MNTYSIPLNTISYTGYNFSKFSQSLKFSSHRINLKLCVAKNWYNHSFQFSDLDHFRNYSRISEISFFPNNRARTVFHPAQSNPDVNVRHTARHIFQRFDRVIYQTVPATRPPLFPRVSRDIPGFPGSPNEPERRPDIHQASCSNCGAHVSPRPLSPLAHPLAPSPVPDIVDRDAYRRRDNWLTVRVACGAFGEEEFSWNPAQFSPWPLTSFPLCPSPVSGFA